MQKEPELRLKGNIPRPGVGKIGRVPSLEMAILGGVAV